MKNVFNFISLTLTLAALCLTSCGTVPKGNDNTLKVLASTTFLADITQNIAGWRAKVESLLPEGAEIYKSNADAYIAQLKELDTWITEQVDTIPAGRRLLVTNHESMGYFAERYGFEVTGSV